METSFKTRTAEISLEKEGYMKIRILPDSVIDDGDAIDNMLVIRNMSEGQKYLKLVDTRGTWSMTAKAKEVSKKNLSVDNTIARAFITDSFLSKITLEFFQSFTTPDLPQKFFTDEKEAVEWLLSKKP